MIRKRFLPSALYPVRHFTVCSAVSHQDRTISFHHKVNLSHTRGKFRAKVSHPLLYLKVYHKGNKKKQSVWNSIVEFQRCVSCILYLVS
jgi:hypothetical protein